MMTGSVLCGTPRRFSVPMYSGRIVAPGPKALP